MEIILETFFLCTIIMSAIAIVLLIFRPLLLKRYKASSIYYIWIIVLLGFIIPIRPSFSFSFIKIDIPKIKENKMSFFIEKTDTAQNKLTTVEDEKISFLSTAKIVFFIWIMGIFIVIIYSINQHLQFKKTVNRWNEEIQQKEILNLLDNIQKEMKISSKIRIFYNPSISSPMLVGFYHPIILLPYFAVNLEELNFILKHELIHYKRKDLFVKILVLLANAFYWFNPIIYFVIKEINLQCELSCDEKVIEKQSIEERKKYCETILHLIQVKLQTKTVFSTNFFKNIEGIKKRVFSIMNRGKKKIGIIFFICIFLIILGGQIVLTIDKEATAQDLADILITKEIDFENGEFSKNISSNKVRSK